MSRDKVIPGFRGIRRDASRHLLGDSAELIEVPDALNMLMRNGSAVKRLGFQLVTEYSIADGDATGQMGEDTVAMDAGLSWPSTIYLLSTTGNESDIPLPVGFPGDGSAPPPGGGSVGGVPPGDDGSGGGGTGGTGGENDPPPVPGDIDPDIRLEVTLPSSVSEHVAFDLVVTAYRTDTEEVDTTFDGTGAVYVARTVDPGDTATQGDPGMVTIAGGTAPNITAGWVNGVWTQSVKVVSGFASSHHLFVAASAGGVGGVGDSCPIYAPTIAVDALSVIIVGTAFDLTYTAGTGYDNGGDELALAFEEYVDDAWQDGTTWTLSGGGAIDITAGWAALEWTESVKVPSVSTGATMVRVKLFYRSVLVATAESDVSGAGANMLLDIKERQWAWGITDPFDELDPYEVTNLIDDSGGTSYSLPQLIAYVNKLAQGEKFIESAYNEWTTGDDDPSGFLLNDGGYASSVSSEAELHTLVLALKRSVITSLATSDCYDKTGQYYHKTDSFTTVMSEAQQNYVAATPLNEGNVHWRVLAGGYWDGDAYYEKRMCGIYCARPTIGISGLASELSKTMHIYGLRDHDPSAIGWPPYVFPVDVYVEDYEFGYDLPALGKWGIVASDALGAATGGEITPGGWIVPDAVAPVATGGDDGYERVFRVEYFCAIVDWGFTNT